MARLEYYLCHARIEELAIKGHFRRRLRHLNEGWLTHFDKQGQAHMVDVSSKEDTLREAVARCEIVMHPQTLELIKTGGMAKGDVLGVARLAGIMAAKETSRLIPLAHPIPLTGINVYFHLKSSEAIEVEARVRTTGKTGVEMEALLAASMAALTVYDMCKAVDRGMTIHNLRLVCKVGGKSGEFRREGEEVHTEGLL